MSFASRILFFAALLPPAFAAETPRTPTPAASTSAAGELESGFRNPPAAARPRVWWHWMNGNVTKEGITEDLRWMKSVGIGGLQNFDASLGTPQVVEKRLAFMTPEWQDAFRHAASLSRELDLELAIATSAGWSQTGGPWVAPEQAMKKVVWSTAILEGGQRRQSPLPLPPNVAGPYQDIPYPSRTSAPAPPFYVDTHVIAFPAPPDDGSENALTPRVHTRSGVLDRSLLADGSLANTVTVSVADATSGITFDYPQPTRIAAITVAVPVRHGFGAPPQFSATLEASDDGTTYRRVADVPPSRADQRTIAFPAVTARSFRVSFRAGDPFSRPIGDGVVPMQFPPVPASIDIAELALHQRMRVNQFVEKAGFAAANDYYAIATPQAPSGSIVKSKDIIDLTRKLGRDGVLDWTPPRGRWIVLRFGYGLTGHMNGPATEEATGLEVDKLNRQHVRGYIDRYLDMYTKAVGIDLVGTQGLRALLSDSYEAGAQNWTEHMPEEFERRRGYDARRWLPSLAGWVIDSSVASDRFLWDYRRTITDLLADAHYGEIASVARERGLLLYGEALEDQRPALGDDMAMRRHADIPMAAMWMYPGRPGPNPTYVADHRGAASVAHVYGQNVAAAESLTSFGYPWAFAPRDLQPVADLQFALGINRIVVHTSVHQPLSDKRPGMSLRPLLGQYFGRTETWAKHAQPWIDYLARSSFLLQQGTYAADVAYFYGQEAPITGLYGLPASEPQPADQPTGYAFDFVNDDVVLNQFSVDRGDLTTPGGMRYRILYLGGTSERMTLAVVRRLEQLVRAGATVVGTPPRESPSLADDPSQFASAVAILWGDDVGAGTVRVLGKGRIMRAATPALALEQLGVSKDFELRGKAATGDVMFLHRRLADGHAYFLSNRTDRILSGDAVFRVDNRLPELWDAESGKISPLSYRLENGRTIVPLELQAHRSAFVVFRTPAKARSWTAPSMKDATLQPLDGEWNVEFPAAHTRLTLPSLANWAVNDDPKVRYYSGSAFYRKTFNLAARSQAGGERVILDLGDVRELAVVTVNGQTLQTLWRPPFRVDITDALIAGKNEMTVEVVNLWVNRLIGDAQPGASPRTFTTGPTYLPGAPLRPSGLLGPVRLLSTGAVEGGG
ncbi:hypothetical protein HNQ60_005433 [Povalibacter uvarum]|uniref:Glycoside hydrolase n=1 Tax=Povalibacter uvarum TaxID=732238 RepID=A0A841HSY2_9GAMM|nr:glycosyl hydrolase [Povalibacter uvarum]MBB6096511.1 hypothetical protein [Povalibacter uvarum]